MSTCTDCEKELIQRLSSIPSKWREQLAKILCEIRSGKSSIDCDEVKECETVTSLSDFELEGTKASIVYKDEKDTSYKRTIDFESIINKTLDDVDPKCVASTADWANYSFKERIGAIIHSHSVCCCAT